MGNDRFEILDTDNNMKLLFNNKLAKLKGIHGDCRMQWLLQYLYFQSECKDSARRSATNHFRT